MGSEEIQRFLNEKVVDEMRALIRVILLLSPIIIVGFAIYELDQWHAPISPNSPQYIGIDDLLAHPDVYQAPRQIIFSGEVYNKSVAGDMILIRLGESDFFRINCTGLDISDVESGMTIYVRGVSYYNDPSKEYFLATDIEIHVSYSLELSIPGAILILIILFVGFKFQLKDFSFSRRSEEETENA